MLDLFFWGILFLVSLFVLIKSSNVFTDNAEKLGLYLGMPAFLVGITIVSIGTSLPELISGLISVSAGAPEINVGNVIGANISNIFLVLGLSALVGKKLKLSRSLSKIDLPSMLIVSGLFILVVFDGVVSTMEALFLVLLFCVYITYTIKLDMKNKLKVKEHKEKVKLNKKIIPLLVGSAFFIYLGAKLTIDSVIALSEIFSVGKEIIAVTAFSIGTTLPELTVSITAARKGNPEMAVGNIIGSTIFNALVVFGFPVFLGTLLFGGSILLSIPIFLLVALFFATVVFFFINQDNEITRKEGVLLLIFYVIFIIKALGFI